MLARQHNAVILKIRLPGAPSRRPVRHPSVQGTPAQCPRQNDSLHLWPAEFHHRSVVPSPIHVASAVWVFGSGGATETFRTVYPLRSGVLRYSSVFSQTVISRPSSSTLTIFPTLDHTSSTYLSPHYIRVIWLCCMLGIVRTRCVGDAPKMRGNIRGNICGEKMRT